MEVKKYGSEEVWKYESVEVLYALSFMLKRVKLRALSKSWLH
jgi:hypothetical protein